MTGKVMSPREEPTIRVLLNGWEIAFLSMYAYIKIFMLFKS